MDETQAGEAIVLSPVERLLGAIQTAASDIALHMNPDPGHEMQPETWTFMYPPVGDPLAPLTKEDLRQRNVRKRAFDGGSQIDLFYVHEDGLLRKVTITVQERQV